MKWTESFVDFLSRVIGKRTIPLVYVIRTTVAVPAQAPTLLAGEPHSNEHESVEGELVARASHSHPLYRDDNKTVYHHIEEATRSTVYAASIKPFQKKKDGRSAWLAIRSQYAGNDKWEAELKKQELLIHTAIWKGQSSFALESFVSQHRNAYVSMVQCAEHVKYQLPNQHSRVGYLLTGIQNSDAGLQAAMASVNTDDGPKGKRNDFEAAAAHLLPYDPVAKRRATGKRASGDVSAAEAGNSQGDGKVSSAKGKPSIGKTGVHLRYYKPAEFRNLTKEQKTELIQWRKNSTKPGSDKSSTGKRKHVTESDVAALVNKKIKLALDKNGEKKDQEGDEAYIMSLIQKAAGMELEEKKTPAPAAKVSSTLQAILKKAKVGKKE